VAKPQLSGFSGSLLNITAAQDRKRLRAPPDCLDYNERSTRQEFLLVPAGFRFRNTQADESAKDATGGCTGCGTAEHACQQSGCDHRTDAGNQPRCHRPGESPQSAPGCGTHGGSLFDFGFRSGPSGGQYTDLVLPESGLPELLDEAVRPTMVGEGGDHSGYLFVLHDSRPFPSG
jgi:hypothetical protein